MVALLKDMESLPPKVKLTAVETPKSQFVFADDALLTEKLRRHYERLVIHLVWKINQEAGIKFIGSRYRINGDLYDLEITNDAGAYIGNFQLHYSPEKAVDFIYVPK